MSAKDVNYSSKEADPEDVVHHAEYSSKEADEAEKIVEALSGTKPSSSSSSAQEEARVRRAALARSKAGSSPSRHRKIPLVEELENEGAAFVEWEEHFDGGDGGVASHPEDEDEEGLHSSLRTNKATAGTMSTRTYDDLDSNGEACVLVGDVLDEGAAEEAWAAEALPPMSVEEAYETVKRYTRTPEVYKEYIYCVCIILLLSACHKYYFCCQYSFLDF